MKNVVHFNFCCLEGAGNDTIGILINLFNYHIVYVYILIFKKKLYTLYYIRLHCITLYYIILYYIYIHIILTQNQKK